jgi:hypothetical protein
VLAPGAMLPVLAALDAQPAGTTPERLNADDAQPQPSLFVTVAV